METDENVIPVRARLDSIRAFFFTAGASVQGRWLSGKRCRTDVHHAVCHCAGDDSEFSVLASVPALKGKGVQLQQWAFEYFVPSAGNMLLEHLQSFARQATNLTGPGVIILIITSVLMLRTIEQTVNRIWKVRSARKGLTSLMMYWAVLSLGPICLGRVWRSLPTSPPRLFSVIP